VNDSTVLLHSVDISIPGYKILRPIGEGGMASVFLAVQESLDREVALKVMAPALAANTEFTERFLKEGRITAKLQHQNLVTVYDIGTHAGVYYLAAEYIPGGTLKERITAGGLSVGEILDIMVEMARGLDFAHQKGFVHRDVKPGNILFRKDGSVVLADFGIAKAMDSSSSSTVAGASIGTPDYMSPEQARAEPVDGRSDLYSLGTVLFEMLTGAPPYQAADPFTVALMHVTQPIPTLPADFAWLQPLINRTMDKQPASRVQTGALLAEEIHQLLAKSPEGASTLSKTAAKSSNRISSGATMQRTRTIHRDAGYPRWLWPTVGAGLALVVLGGWFWVHQSDALPSAQVLEPAHPVTATLGASDAGNPNGSASGPDVNELKPIDDQLGGDVASWLAQAESNKEYGLTNKTDIGRGLSFPDDTSAVALYKKVLVAQPDNQQAKKGLHEIAEFYLKYSRTLCDKQAFDACKMEAEYGLAADPDNADLKKLNQQAEDASRGITPSGN